MRAPRGAIVVESGATVPLRFDDLDFLRALEEDGQDPDSTGVLARAMEVAKATDVDFSPFIEDGWVLHVRPNIRSDERSAMLNAGQKSGGGVDVREALRSQWGSWVMRVTVDDDLELTPKMAATFKALSSTNRKAREDAYGELPSQTADRLTCRLRAHIEAARRPADRDPDKTLGEAEALSLGTGHSSSGDHYRSDGADR